MGKQPKDSKARAKGRRANKPPERHNGVREVGELLPRIGGTAFRRFGFTRSVLIERWRDIVGPVYARWSLPESLRQPRSIKGQKPAGGTLTIRVEAAFATQMQHVAPQLIERINRILGANSVGRLRLVHGEVAAAERRQPRQPADTPGRDHHPNVASLPDGQLQRINDPGLRAALEELASQLAAGRQPPSVS